VLFEGLRNQIRALLRMRTPRAVARRGNKPAIGAAVVREDLRLTVQAGLSDELWRWLLEQGWRESQFQPDRRRYRELPAALVTRLIDARPDEYAEALAAAVEKAAYRPVLRGGGRR
jgi:hypothetical protein